MKGRSIIAVCVLLLGAGKAWGQQDPQYTQYLFNMLALNPAYAGSSEQWDIRALSRHQWTGFEGRPVSQTLSGHSTVWHQSLALGGTITRDAHGPITQTGLFVDATYRIMMDENKLAFGLKLGANHFNGDFAGLDPMEDNDVVFMQSVSGKIDPQFGFGTMYYGDKFYVGLSVPKILNTRFFQTDSVGTVFLPGQQDHILLSGGYVFELSPYLKFKPTALLKGVSGAPWSMDLSAHFLFYDQLWLGAAYRHEDALSIIAQFEMRSGISAGYAFDYTLSELQQYSNGTHEIMLGYRFGDPILGIRSPRYF